MTVQRSFKRLVRARMAKTGESYTTARAQLLAGTDGKPSGARHWRCPHLACSDERIVERTGRGWEEWFDLLDSWGAESMGHTELARRIADRSTSMCSGGMRKRRHELRAIPRDAGVGSGSAAMDSSCRIEDRRGERRARRSWRSPIRRGGPRGCPTSCCPSDRCRSRRRRGSMWPAARPACSSRRGQGSGEVDDRRGALAAGRSGRTGAAQGLVARGVEGTQGRARARRSAGIREPAMTAAHEPRVLVDGLAYVESPRWHDGRLVVRPLGSAARSWPSTSTDATRRWPAARTASGGPSTGCPMAVCSLTGEGLRASSPTDRGRQHADLAELSDDWNEIVVDGRGNIYVNGGCDFDAGPGDPPGVHRVGHAGRFRRAGR